MRSILNLTWKLLVVALAAGLVLGLANEVTKEPIAQQSIAAADGSRRVAMPEAHALNAIKYAGVDDSVSDFYNAVDENGKLIGYIATASAYGYGGPIEVMVGMSMDGTVTGVSIGRNSDFSETAGLGAKVQSPSFAEQFVGDKYTGPQEFSSSGGGFRIPAGTIWVVQEEGGDDGGLDAISGATYSSVAVLEAYNAACEALHNLIGGEIGE